MLSPMIMLASAHALLGLVFASTRGDRWRRRAVEALVVYVLAAVGLALLFEPGAKSFTFAPLLGAIHLGSSWAAVAWAHRDARAAPAPPVSELAAPPPLAVGWCADMGQEHAGARAPVVHGAPVEIEARA